MNYSKLSQKVKKADNAIQRTTAFNLNEMSDFFEFFLTVSIRIIADFGTPIFQFIKKLRWAIPHEFTTVSVIIFIHCVCYTNSVFLNLNFGLFNFSIDVLTCFLVSE